MMLMICKDTLPLNTLEKGFTCLMKTAVPSLATLATPATPATLNRVSQVTSASQASPAQFSVSIPSTPTTSSTLPNGLTGKTWSKILLLNAHAEPKSSLYAINGKGLLFFDTKKLCKMYQKWILRHFYKDYFYKFFFPDIITDIVEQTNTDSME